MSIYFDLVILFHSVLLFLCGSAIPTAFLIYKKINNMSKIYIITDILFIGLVFLLCFSYYVVECNGGINVVLQKLQNM